MNKTVVYFFIDESGDKGYSNSIPLHGLGVMAGFLLNDWELPYLKEDFEQLIYDINLEPSKKLHMRELSIEQKNKSIQFVKESFKKYGVKFFYSAINTEKYSNFVGKSHNQKKELMHSQLLENISQKAFGLCTKLIDKFNTDVEIKIVSDKVDAGVIQLFEKKIEYIANIHNGNANKTYYKKGKYVESRINKISDDPRPKNGKFTFDISIDNSDITFISDILSYTTFNHLIKFSSKNPSSPLNTMTSTVGHPLEDLLILQIPPEMENINIENVLFGPK